MNKICTNVPEKLVSIGRSHFSKTGQDPLVMTVTLLRDMLQNLPELNTHTNITRGAHTGFINK